MTKGFKLIKTIVILLITFVIMYIVFQYDSSKYTYENNIKSFEKVNMDVIESNLLEYNNKFIYFGMEDCNNCRKNISETVDFVKDNNLEVIYIDLNKEMERDSKLTNKIIDEYKIYNTPTLAYIKEGKLVKLEEDISSKKSISNFLMQLENKDYTLNQ
ncbi:thioredoxin family protein [Miniphocaeibacter halophilus]|uniref:Thioredoxin family protein n=1 Tax=Miniphocaeibacter halophilus TaxID=2931922 RepID=A0AC61MR46_9FIRM|nr:thioredoxin family protein [Miniphocaeibacter halophilus]QQK06919.1 thioredoxin family protein [Miniphocaeibacter halophilus]